MVTWIKIAILKTLWIIVISGPISLINEFNKVLIYLSNGVVKDLIFGGQSNFSWSTIPVAFWGFCIISAAVIVIIFWCQYIGLMFGETKEMKNKLVIAVKMTALAVVFIFFVPIGYFLFNWFLSEIINHLIEVFGLKTNNLAGILWNVGNPDWNCHDAYTGDWFTPPNNIGNYNFLAEIIAVGFMVFILFMFGFALIQKSFEIFFLFIISPILAATMVNDNGKRMRTWKDQMIGKSLSGVSTMSSYYSYLLAISCLLGGKILNNDFSVVIRQLLVIILVVGGGLATLSMNNLINSYIGETVNIRDGHHTLNGLKTTAALLAGTPKALKNGLNHLAGRNNRNGEPLKSKSKQKGGKDESFDLNDNKQNSGFGNWEGQDETSAFDLPETSLKDRSGIPGLVGSFLSTGLNTLYSMSEPAITGWNRAGQTADFGTKLYEAGKATAGAALNSAANTVTAPFKGIYNYGKDIAKSTKQEFHNAKKGKRKKNS